MDKQSITSLLELEHVTKAYGKHVVVDDISFQMVPGELVALLGENGAGKSTTLKLIIGLLTPDKGTIRCLDGRVVSGSDRMKRLSGYLAEQPFLYPTLSGMEFLELVGSFYRLSRAECQQRAVELLERLRLLDVAQQRIQNYSQGMYRRLAICCILMHRPWLLLLDEPLNGLDPANVRDVKNLLAELCEQGCAVLVSTHLLDVAERLCSRSIILTGGKIIADGSLEHLRQEAKQAEHSTLEMVFFALTNAGERERKKSKRI